MNRYHNISGKSLFDLLVNYIDHYTDMVRGNKDHIVCKQLIEDIIEELKARKEIAIPVNASPTTIFLTPKIKTGIAKIL